MYSISGKGSTDTSPRRFSTGHTRPVFSISFLRSSPSQSSSNTLQQHQQQQQQQQKLFITTSMDRQVEKKRKSKTKRKRKRKRNRKGEEEDQEQEDGCNFEKAFALFLLFPFLEMNIFAFLFVDSSLGCCFSETPLVHPWPRRILLLTR